MSTGRDEFGQRTVSLASLAGVGQHWVSIGVPLGVANDPDDPSAPFAVARLGERQVQLSVDLYSLYLQAFVPLSAAELGAFANQVGPGVAEAMIERLADEGLIARISGHDMDDAVAGARLLSHAAGVGNSAEEIYTFTVLDPGSGVGLTIDVLAFTIWGCCDGRTTVSGACNRVARELDIDVGAVRTKGAALVFAMMQSRLAFLDV